jgi:hypothetical protein
MSGTKVITNISNNKQTHLKNPIKSTQKTRSALTLSRHRRPMWSFWMCIYVLSWITNGCKALQENRHAKEENSQLSELKASHHINQSRAIICMSTQETIVKTPRNKLKVVKLTRCKNNLRDQNPINFTEVILQKTSKSCNTIQSIFMTSLIAGWCVIVQR